jgi:hypothetical protein
MCKDSSIGIYLLDENSYHIITLYLFQLRIAFFLLSNLLMIWIRCWHGPSSGLYLRAWLKCISDSAHSPRKYSSSPIE